MTDRPMTDTRTLNELLDEVERDTAASVLGVTRRGRIREMAERLRAIKAEVESNMSSRENYTVEALSNTILRIQRILF